MALTQLFTMRGMSLPVACTIETVEWQVLQLMSRKRGHTHHDILQHISPEQPGNFARDTLPALIHTHWHWGTKGLAHHYITAIDVHIE